MESEFVKAVSTEIQATETGGFRGYASKFLNIDRQGDMIIPGAFSKALPEFIDAGGLVLADHENKTGAVIGTLIDAREDMNGLMVDVQFSATDIGQRIRRLIMEKALNKMSIQFSGYVKQASGKDIEAIWKSYGYQPSEYQRKLAKQGAKVVTGVEEIREVSVVPIPANPEATILAVKSFFDGQDGESAKTVEQLQAIVKRAAIVDVILGRMKKR